MVAGAAAVVRRGAREVVLLRRPGTYETLVGALLFARLVGAFLFARLVGACLLMGYAVETGLFTVAFRLAFVAEAACLSHSLTGFDPSSLCLLRILLVLC